MLERLLALGLILKLVSGYVSLRKTTLLPVVVAKPDESKTQKGCSGEFGPAQSARLMNLSKVTFISPYHWLVLFECAVYDEIHGACEKNTTEVSEYVVDI